MAEEIIKYAQVEISELMDIITERDRLRQENKQLREWLDRAESGEGDEININNNYRSALEEIREMVSRHYPGRPRDILDIINEVLK